MFEFMMRYIDIHPFNLNRYYWKHWHKIHHKPNEQNHLQYSSSLHHLILCLCYMGMVK